MGQLFGEHFTCDDIPSGEIGSQSCCFLRLALLVNLSLILLILFIFWQWRASIVGQCIEEVLFSLDCDILLKLLLAYECDLVQMQSGNQDDLAVALEICNSLNFASIINC